MNQSKKQYIKDLHPSYKEYQAWLLAMPRKITAGELVNRANTYFNISTKKLDEDCILVKKEFLKGISLTPHGWRIKAIVETQEHYQENGLTKCANPTGNDWNELHSFTHFYEIEDAQVSILKHNFPEIWEKL